MKENPIIISKRKDPILDITIFVVGVIIFVIGICFIVNGCLFFFPQLIWVIPGSIFIVSGCLFAYEFACEYENLQLFIDRLQATTTVGRCKKVIYLDAITRWEIYNTEIKRKKLEPQKVQHLTLFANSSKYHIILTDFTNYAALRDYLIKGKTGNHVYQKSSYSFKQIGTILLWACGMCYMFGGPIILRQPRSNLFRLRDHTIISAVIATIPEIKKYKGTTTITLSLKQYPGFDFTDEFTHWPDSVNGQIKNGDTVLLEIPTDIYLKKLVRTRLPGFWEKYFNYPEVPVYKIQDHKTIFYGS